MRDLSAIAADISVPAGHEKRLLRFNTCGSVDDGKSTLIGRLLFESKVLFDDQLAALEADSKGSGPPGEEFDFALLVDGLSAEREQGITIDVSYRFFSTERGKFIVADTPGHEQYTRNMVTGASTADLSDDPRRRSQGRPHADAAPQLPRLAPGNPARRAGRQQDGPRRLLPGASSTDRSGVSSSRARIGLPAVTCIPVSAVKGTTSSARPPTPWYEGATLMEPARLAIDARPPARAAVQVAGAMGEPSQCRFPRLRRTIVRRPAPQGERHSRAAAGGGAHSESRAS